MRLRYLFNWQLFVDILPQLLETVPTVLLITIVGFSVGLVIGLGAALVKIHRIPVLRQIIAMYISFFRGTPLLVQLFIPFFGIPVIIIELNYAFGWSLNVRSITPIHYALVVISLNTGAYLTEAVRSALESVHKGQIEAAYSIGMSGWQTVRRIIIPQAFLVALPNLGNTIIMLVKDTSLVFTITVVEVLSRARWLATEHARPFEAYIGAATVYWAICLIVEFLVKTLEKTMKRRRGLDDNS